METNHLGEEYYSITVSDMIEYLFCPRFIYFMHCLKIPQHEERGSKVIKGRQLHNLKLKYSKDYLRKRLGVVRKFSNVYLKSTSYHIRGMVDEVLFFENGMASPLDYKYAEYHEKIFDTYGMQSVAYALMIEENFGIKVETGYIVFARSKNLLKAFSITEERKEILIRVLDEIFKLIQNCSFPEKAKSKNKCQDCCYKNLCL